MLLTWENELTGLLRQGPGGTSWPPDPARLRPPRGEMRREAFGGSGAVGAHQHCDPARRIAAVQVLRDLGQRGVDHDVVSGGVRPRLPRSEQLAHRLPTTPLP